MAGTLSHFKFMVDLGKKINFNENNDLFLLAGQGHDLLFFIKLKDLKDFGKRGKMVSDVASHDFKKLVIRWQEEILNSDNKELEILLYGYIAHHVLDSYIHPWINDKCNCYFNKSDKSTWDNNGKHEILESVIDYLVLNPYKFKIPKVILDKNTIDSLNNLFKDIYDLDNIGLTFGDGIKNVRAFIHLYRFDRLGIKKWGYKIIDLLSAKNASKFSFLSFHYARKLCKEVENNYLCAFDKLYKAALSEAAMLILKIKESLANKKVLLITWDKSAT